MANQLAVDKSFAMNNLRSAGYSKRRIAQTLGVSRGAVRRHLQALNPNSTTVPTGSNAPPETGSLGSNNTKALTGSGDQSAVPLKVDQHGTSNSQCESFRDIIIAKCDIGLTAKRIHQDLVADHSFEGKYWSANRFVKSLGAKRELPYRRMEVAPGEELQVDFGTGAKICGADGTYRRTHAFRCGLGYSRKGYTEAVFKQDIRSFLANRNLRAVTAGRDIFWVFDKQLETFRFIRRLVAWEHENLVKRMIHWMASPQGMEGYVLEALSVLGVHSWLKKNPSADDWVPVIESLGIKVRIFQRSQIYVKRFNHTLWLEDNEWQEIT